MMLKGNELRVWLGMIRAELGGTNLKIDVLLAAATERIEALEAVAKQTIDTLSDMHDDHGVTLSDECFACELQELLSKTLEATS